MRVFLQDSTSTTGAGKTGLTSTSTGLIISTIADNEATATTYTAAATNVETVTTLGTFAAPTAGKCRFREVDATNFPGVYEIHIADARYAVASSTQLLVSVQCTGVAPVIAEVQLVAVDLMDSVRLGLTALPNVAQGTTGAISTGNASGQVTVVTNNDKTGYSLTTAPLTTAQTASAVWDALLASYTTANSFGARIIRGTSTSPSYETFITGSNHIAADVHQMQASVITAAAIAANAITSAELDATALAAIADYILLRKLDRTGQGTGSTANERTVLSALRYLRNKVDISASTMTITTEDDTTTAWTATLSSTAGLNPVTGVDPA